MYALHAKTSMWTRTGLPVMVVMLGSTLYAMPGGQDQWLCEDCLNCEDFKVMLSCTNSHQQTEKSINKKATSVQLYNEC